MALADSPPPGHELTNLFKTFLSVDSGATAIGYGRLSAIIAVVVISSASGLDFTMSGKFNNICAMLK